MGSRFSALHDTPTAVKKVVSSRPDSAGGPPSVSERTCAANSGEGGINGIRVDGEGDAREENDGNGGLRERPAKGNDSAIGGELMGREGVMSLWETEGERLGGPNSITAWDTGLGGPWIESVCDW